MMNEVRTMTILFGDVTTRQNYLEGNLRDEY
jgi:hypothetical protein